jgi:hypothetical protein
MAEVLGGIPAAVSGLDLAIRDLHVDLERLAAVVARLEGEVGLIRSADLPGIVARLDATAPTTEPPAEAQADVTVNGRHD